MLMRRWFAGAGLAACIGVRDPLAFDHFVLLVRLQVRLYSPVCSLGRRHRPHPLARVRATVVIWMGVPESTLLAEDMSAVPMDSYDGSQGKSKRVRSPRLEASLGPGCAQPET